MLEFLLHLDRELLLIINGLHSPFFDALMEFASAKISWVPFYIVLLIVVFKKYRWSGLYILLAIIILITLSDQVSSSFLKPMIGRLRPCREEDLKLLLHLVNGHCGGKYGFVSSHAANSFALAMFLSLIFRNKYWLIGLFFWATLVSYSRVYLGVHYPGDILGGAILGAGVGVLVFQFLKRIKKLSL